MKLAMFCQFVLLCVSFAALVALEKLFFSVRYHVALQIARSDACVIALVTLVWLFSCVVHHHVYFKITSCNT